MTYKYEVALSFAGEDREFAEGLARGLREAGVKVFYDNYYAEELWGEDLSVSLRDIYHDSSQFCIMILSENYINKMWPSHERQQAIERLIRQKGKAYILPVRLDGFSGDIPGMSESISYLAVTSNDSQKVVDTFLRKIGRDSQKVSIASSEKIRKPYIPKLNRSFTDKEKNQFLRSSFDEIVNVMDTFASETQKEHSHFEYELERVTTRKTVFTMYESGNQVAQCKILLGGILGGDSITFLHGNHIDIHNDNSINESISLEEYEGELKLKPVGMASFETNGDKLMSPREVAEYLWEIVCRDF